jgi:diguanylate cyclase (GGDEF)-like protein
VPKINEPAVGAEESLGKAIDRCLGQRVGDLDKRQGLLVRIGRVPPSVPGRTAATGGGRSVKPWSVRTYLVLISAAAVVSVTAAAGYGFAWSAARARTDAITEMTFQADRAAASISAAVATAGKTVEGLAAQPGLGKVFAQPTGCTLTSDGVSPFPSVRLDIVRPDGLVACSSDATPAVRRPGVHAGSGWLRDVLRSPKPVVIWGATDAATGKPALVVGAPLRSGGAAAGVVVLFLHLPETTPALTRDLAGSEHASFTLVDRGEHVVLSTSETAEHDSDQLRETRFPDSAAQGDWAGVDGARRLFGSGDVAGSDWRVYVGVKRSAVLADARGALYRQALVGLLPLLILAAAVWILNRRVAGPLRTVIDAVARARRDPDGVRVGEAGTAELVLLAREFNAMLDVRAGHDAQLMHQATHDPLTGLANRVLLRDQLDHALRRDSDGGNAAVMFLGLNRFKMVTDGYGHDAGDLLLVQVAARLSRALPPGDTLARLGGDEFAVLCENVHPEDAVGVAERLHRCLEEPFRGPAADLVLQAAIGIAVARESTTGSEQLLREADSAMRQAKRTARDWCLFDDALQARATSQLQVEHALRLALERGELFLHYQPLLDVATGRTVGAEALVRWQHPERGLVPPLEFIPVAEETGQIAAIGRFVLTRACQQAAAWAAAGHPLRISVNVAVDQLRQDDFPALVRQVLAETGLAPGQLCLEITESSLMREADHGAAELARLRQLGVHLAIDDFGTGYSSLSYLHQLPVDELKIDRSFISRLDQEGRDRHLVEAIIGMARALRLTVVAEGVETGEQLELLAGLGCQRAQGYLFAPPQTAEAFLARIDTKPTRSSPAESIRS